jgi:chitinase
MGTWESGVFDYHDLAANYVPTMTRHFDDSAKAPWLYDATKQIMISYDDAESLAIRGKYVEDRGLGGVMVWELSGDDKARTLGHALWASLH